MLKIYILISFLIMLSGCSQNPEPQGKIGQSTSALFVSGDGNFGTVNYGDIKYKTLVFQNQSSSAITVSPSLRNSEHFSLGLTLGCQSVQPGKGCVVKVFFNSNFKTSGTYLDFLDINDQSIELSAIISEVPSVSYAFSLNNSTGNNIDLGTIKTRELQLVQIKVTNNSPKIGTLGTLTSSNNFFEIVHNRCVNVILHPGKSCFAKILVKGKEATSIETSQLTFDQSSSQISISNQAQAYPSNFQASTSELELGDFYETGEQLIKAIILQNQGTGAGDLPSIAMPSGYQEIFNNCQGVKPGFKCVVRFTFQNLAKPKGQHEELLDFGDSNVTVVTNQVNRLDEVGSILVYSDSYIHKSSCSEINLEVKDLDNLPFISSQDIVLNSSHQLFQDNQCLVATNSVSIPAFTSSSKAYIKHVSDENILLTLSYNQISSQKSIIFYENLVLNSNYENLRLNQSFQIIPNKGVPPYSYQVISGSGTVSSNGLYTPSVEGETQVQVSDFLNQTISISFNQVAPIVIGSTFDLVINQTYQLQPTKGLPPYSYVKESGVGSISASGLFSAGATSGIFQIKVVDSLQQEALVSGVVFGPLQISPTNSNLMVSNTTNFSATGGKAPLTYSLISGVGSISSAGFFEAGSISGTAQIKVVDILGQESVTSITIHPQITINTTSCLNIPESKSCSVSSSGGYGTRVYSVSQGSISGAGLFVGTCGSNFGQTQISVTDSLGNQASSTVFVPCVYSSCMAVKTSGYGLTTNVYWLDPDGLNNQMEPYQILCDMDTDGGGWEVIQQRISTSDFYKTYSEYQNGFGNVSLTGNYWIGNDRINKLSPPSAPKEIYFKMKRNSGANHYQRYSAFSVKDAANKFRMNVNGYNQVGNAGDSFSGHNSSMFSAKDSDNDIYAGHCSQLYVGAWWYYNCHDSNLNGIYGSTASAQGINWASLTGYSESLNQIAILVRQPHYTDYPRTCLDAKNKGILNQAGNTGDGIYTIDPDGKNTGINPITVTCDMTNGGWTLINNQFPVSYNSSSCIAGYGNIDVNGNWRLSANQAGGGSSTHGGCGISLRLRLPFSQIKLSDSSFTSNLNCGNVLFPNANLYIVKDTEGPVAEYSGMEFYYPGWDYISKDSITDGASVYNQSAHGLANQTYSVTPGEYFIHMGVGAFTGCVGRTVLTKIWFK